MVSPTLVVALCAGLGAYFLVTAIGFGRRSIVVQPNRVWTQRRARLDDSLVHAGIHKEDHRTVLLMVAALFAAGTFGGWLVFGGAIGPLVLGMFTASFPVAGYRARGNKRRTEAAEAWPRMIEEIRLLCGSLGRPIPQALFEVGRSAPTELRDGFAEAEREWRISTDFERAVTVLKAGLADPTADAACETLLVAHRLGGADIERRLAALAEDRQLDLRGRKDARAKQAGVRFARRFVLIVPFGMAIAGMSIGNGRAAYATANGQIGIVIALVTLGACWWWAGKLIRLPQEERVFRA